MPFDSSPAAMSPEALLRLLADGRRHSGQALAERFGVTRAAVWKQIGRLGDWGVEVEALPGSGYRLRRPLDLLDCDAILAAVAPAASARVERLELFTVLDSTNGHLLEAPPPSPGALNVCLAEYQRSGRGRRGRSWHAPAGAGLCLSAAWRFAETPPDLTALPLAVGVAARRAIERLCDVRIALKWPNDLVHQGAKLGGVLVELAGEAHGGCTAVAGIGINVAVPDSLLREVNGRSGGAVDLARAAGGTPPRRSVLAAGLVEALVELFDAYGREGFAAYRSEYAAADYLLDRRVSVDEASGRLAGTARGVDASGALIVEAGGARRRVFSGDVSVRATP